MNQIEVIGNYLIITEDIGGPGEAIKEFPQSSSQYLHNEARAEITVDGPRGDYTITEASIAANEWQDGTPAILDLAGMLALLRANTGNFNVPVTFESLPDVPGYAGNGGKTLVINDAENAIGVRQDSKEAFFYLDADGIGSNPTEVADHSFNNTGLTFSFVKGGSPGEYLIKTNEAADFRKIWCAVGSTDDGGMKMASIVDNLGNVDITIRKYMFDTAAPVAWGLNKLFVHIKLIP